MPNVIFLMTTPASNEMSEGVFDKMSRAVAQAVSDTLTLEGPHQVVTYELVAKRTLNASPVQVLCLASKNESRLAKLVELRDNIGKALQALSSDPECAEFYEVVGKVESWPIMPDGSWAEVPLV